MPLTLELPERNGWWPLVVALPPSAGIFLGGLNSFVGQDVVGLCYALMLAAVLLLVPPSPRFWPAAWPVLAMFAAAFAWIVAVSLGLFGNGPVAPDLAAPGLIGLAGLLASFLCGGVLGNRRITLSRVADWFLLLGVLGLVWSLAMGGVDTDLDGMDPREGRFLGTLANANASAIAFADLAGLALASALHEGVVPWSRRVPLHQRFRALAYWTTLLMMLGATLLTGSRSGAVLAVLVVAAIGWHGVRTRVSTRALVPLLAAAVIVAASLFSDVVLQRFHQLPDELSVRLLLWQHSAAIVARAPVFGYGIGSFSIVSAHFLDGTRAAQAISMVNSPHDIVLRLLIDGGVPYALLVATAFAASAMTVFGAARRRGLDIIELGFAAMIVATLCSSSIDLALEVPAIAAATMSWIGMLWGRALTRRAQVGIEPARVQPAMGKRRIST